MPQEHGGELMNEDQAIWIDVNALISRYLSEGCELLLDKRLAGSVSAPLVDDLVGAFDIRRRPGAVGGVGARGADQGRDGL